VRSKEEALLALGEEPYWVVWLVLSAEQLVELILRKLPK
jgi:hypothetical protein